MLRNSGSRVVFCCKPVRNAESFGYSYLLKGVLSERKEEGDKIFVEIMAENSLNLMDSVFTYNKIKRSRSALK